MKKIGILTHWSIPNYGAFLQAYALRNVLEEMVPDTDVKQIAYMNKMHSKVYYGLELHELYKYWPINPHFYLDLLNRLRRREEIVKLRDFKKYYMDLIPHTLEYDKYTIKKAEFDVLVLGSDILWDYSIPFYGQDKYVFGHGINAKKIIPYAASFGTVNSNKKHPQYVVDAFSKYYAISVRDVNSQNIVKDIAGETAELVLDPTLLWDFKSDKNINQNTTINPYVAVYGSFFSDEQIRDVQQFCQKRGYKIIFLDSGGDTCTWCDEYVSMTSMSPFDWCRYIMNSEAVVTCTFHGFMFGLIFNKKILFNATDFMRVKIEEFLQYLKLSDAMFDASFKNQINIEWDYDAINERIAKRREKSILYIKNNI